MTTKEWLNRGRYLSKEIDKLMEEREAAWAIATKTTGCTADDRVQQTKRNTSEESFVRYALYAAELNSRIDELMRVKHEILFAIDQVDNPTLRMLLQLRYINFETWEKIAEELEMSDYWVRTSLHVKALQEIERIRELNTL